MSPGDMLMSAAKTRKRFNYAFTTEEMYSGNIALAFHGVDSWHIHVQIYQAQSCP